MKAFQQAIEKNCAISLDVQVIGEMEIIAFRDDNLKRMCGITGAVAELRCSELRAFTLLMPLTRDPWPRHPNRFAITQ